MSASLGATRLVLGIRSYTLLRPISRRAFSHYSHTRIEESRSKPEDQKKKQDTNKVDDNPDSKLFNNSQTSKDFLQSLKPYLDTSKQYYTTTKEKIDSVIIPFKFHLGKAKDAIKEVNEKLALQEKESANYDFKQDFTDKSTKDKTIKGLPSERERRRKLWAKKLELYIDSLQETIFTATRALNDVTGYSSIQKLRSSIEALEEELRIAKERSKISKVAYGDAIERRLETQKEVNELLQRKSSWSPSDLERFTSLYKDDHESASLEEKAKEEMEQAEAREEELQDKLSNAILTRYHEEQIWSDKIRRTSTWGTFGLMGINIVLFLVFQLALEPWKRKRLVGNFEEKVQRVLEQNSSEQNERLDLMNQKVEELKRNDRLPALDEIQEAEIFENEADWVEPPTIRTLPYPLHTSSLAARLRSFILRLVKPLESSYKLLLYSNYEAVTIQKSEIIAVSSTILTFGVILGVITGSLFT